MSARRFEHRIAVSVLDSLPLAETNRRMADYWLSLWTGDKLPPRSAFSPSAVRDLLPGIQIFEFKPNAYMRVRLAGTAINQAFGRDITGVDLMAISPDHSREGRMARSSRVAEGMISFVIRRGESRMGKPVESQEIQLPFADMTEDGARQIMFHTNWRPAIAEPGVADIVDPLLPPAEFTLYPLWDAPPIRGAL